jgi:hypothetical protein
LRGALNLFDPNIALRCVQDNLEVKKVSAASKNPLLGPAGKVHCRGPLPIVKFRKYRAFDNGAVRELYTLLRSAMLGARKASIVHRLINDQTLPGIMAGMPVGDWRQWAKERPTWIGNPVEDAFWAFIDQKWRDSLNVAAAEPAGWDQGGEPRKGVKATGGGEQEKQAVKKAAPAGVHVAMIDNSQAAPSRAQKRCKFAELAGFTGSHPPWLCKVFKDKSPEERNRIIEDNKLCLFCLLHNTDEVCFSKVNKTKPICEEPGCKGQHNKCSTRC